MASCRSISDQVALLTRRKKRLRARVLASNAPWIVGTYKGILISKSLRITRTAEPGTGFGMDCSRGQDRARPCLSVIGVGIRVLTKVLITNWGHGRTSKATINGPGGLVLAANPLGVFLLSHRQRAGREGRRRMGRTVHRPVDS